MTRMPSSRARAPMAAWSAADALAELGHHAQHGDAPTRRQGRQRLEGGRHRRRVGVVGVVEDDARRSAPWRAPSASATARLARGPGPPRLPRRPRRDPAAAAASAFSTWWRPRTRSVTLARSHGDASTNVGRSSSSSVRSSARTSPPSPKVITVACGARRHGRDAPIGGVEDRDAAGRQRLDQLALGTRHVVDGAELLGVHGRDPGDDAHGRAGDRAQLRDVADAPRAHLDHDGLGAVGRVEQREGHAQLVVERLGAGGGDSRSLRMLARRSFTEVLPTEPGDPEHRARQPRARAKRPAACRARRVSSTTIAVPPSCPARGQVRGRAGRQRRADELVAVALGDDRHEELPAPDGAGVLRGAVDGDVGASRRPPTASASSLVRRCMRSESRSSRLVHSAHARLRPRPPGGAVRRPVGRARGVVRVGVPRAAGRRRGPLRARGVGITREGDWVRADDAIAALHRGAGELPAPRRHRAAGGHRHRGRAAAGRHARDGRRHPGGRPPAAPRPPRRGRHRAGDARAGRRPLRRLRRARLRALHGQAQVQGRPRRPRHPAGAMGRPARHRAGGRRAPRRRRRAPLPAVREAGEPRVVGRREPGRRGGRARRRGRPRRRVRRVDRGRGERATAARSRSPCSATPTPRASVPG